MWYIYMIYFLLFEFFSFGISFLVSYVFYRNRLFIFFLNFILSLSCRIVIFVLNVSCFEPRGHLSFYQFFLSVAHLIFLFVFLHFRCVIILEKSIVCAVVYYLSYSRLFCSLRLFIFVVIFFHLLKLQGIHFILDLFFTAIIFDLFLI